MGRLQIHKRYIEHKLKTQQNCKFCHGEVHGIASFSHDILGFNLENNGPFTSLFFGKGIFSTTAT